MKKLMLIVAMLAMVAFAVTPAIAQFSQDSDQDADSVELSQDASAVQSGDNSNQCVGSQLVGNTGNAQSSSQFLQYGSEGDVEVEDSGSSVDVSPSNGTECSQSVNQTATAKG
jgi:hypothetical protein